MDSSAVLPEWVTNSRSGFERRPGGRRSSGAALAASCLIFTTLAGCTGNDLSVQGTEIHLPAAGDYFVYQVTGPRYLGAYWAFLFRGETEILDATWQAQKAWRVDVWWAEKSAPTSGPPKTQPFPALIGIDGLLRHMIYPCTKRDESFACQNDQAMVVARERGFPFAFGFSPFWGRQVEFDRTITEVLDVVGGNRSFSAAFSLRPDGKLNVEFTAPEAYFDGYTTAGFPRGVALMDPGLGMPSRFEVEALEDPDVAKSLAAEYELVHHSRVEVQPLAQTLAQKPDPNFSRAAWRAKVLPGFNDTHTTSELPAADAYNFAMGDSRVRDWTTNRPDWWIRAARLTANASWSETSAAGLIRSWERQSAVAFLFAADAQGLVVEVRRTTAYSWPNESPSTTTEVREFMEADLTGQVPFADIDNIVDISDVGQFVCEIRGNCGESHSYAYGHQVQSAFHALTESSLAYRFEWPGNYTYQPGTHATEKDEAVVFAADGAIWEFQTRSDLLEPFM